MLNISLRLAGCENDATCWAVHICTDSKLLEWFAVNLGTTSPALTSSSTIGTWDQTREPKRVASFQTSSCTSVQDTVKGSKNETLDLRNGKGTRTDTWRIYRITFRSLHTCRWQLSICVMIPACAFVVGYCYGFVTQALQVSVFGSGCWCMLPKLLSDLTSSQMWQEHHGYQNPIMHNIHHLTTHPDPILLPPTMLPAWPRITSPTIVVCRLKPRLPKLKILNPEFQNENRTPSLHPVPHAWWSCATPVYIPYLSYLDPGDTVP